MYLPHLVHIPLFPTAFTWPNVNIYVSCLASGHFGCLLWSGEEQTGDRNSLLVIQKWINSSILLTCQSFKGKIYNSLFAFYLLFLFHLFKLLTCNLQFSTWKAAWVKERWTQCISTYEILDQETNQPRKTTWRIAGGCSRPLKNKP